MAKMPAFGRELAEMRRFGDKRPRLNTVMVTDNWLAARIHRALWGVALVADDPTERYSFPGIHDLDVVLVMDRPWMDLLRALRRGRPRSLTRIERQYWLAETERLVRSWTLHRRRAA